jgi:hypothetical protein
MCLFPGFCLLMLNLLNYFILWFLSQSTFGWEDMNKRILLAFRHEANICHGEVGQVYNRPNVICFSTLNLGKNSSLLIQMAKNLCNFLWKKSILLRAGRNILSSSCKLNHSTRIHFFLHLIFFFLTEINYAMDKPLIFKICLSNARCPWMCILNHQK